MLNTMRSMFGNRYAALSAKGDARSLIYTAPSAKGDARSLIYTALSGLRISWLCHFIPLYGMLRYYALSGQAPTGQNTLGWGIALSYNNTEISSPVRARYISEAVSPLANKKEAV